MSRFALIIEYDGTNYAGWQLQNDQPTIQGAIENALQQLTQRNVRVTGSGRTDAGVHARAQVAHFDSRKSTLSEENYRRGLNTYLNDDIIVKDCQKVADDFHARFQAIQRDYSYSITSVPVAIHRQYLWYVPDSLDLNLLEQAAEIIPGKHDFRSFMHAQSDVRSTICEITESSWKITSKKLRYLIYGNRFLHNMVRSLVGTMIEVARGRFSLQEFREFVEEPDKEAPVVCAPAHGLVLEQVHYEKGLLK